MILTQDMLVSLLVWLAMPIFTALVAFFAVIILMRFLSKQTTCIVDRFKLDIQKYMRECEEWAEEEYRKQKERDLDEWQK